MPPSKTRPCFFSTNLRGAEVRAGFGVRREAGECKLTKQYYGEVVEGGRYTICQHCRACTVRRVFGEDRREPGEGVPRHALCNLHGCRVRDEYIDDSYNLTLQ